MNDKYCADAPEDNRSPALAAMVAALTIPYQYNKFVQVTVTALNEQCPCHARRIGK